MTASRLRKVDRPPSRGWPGLLIAPLVALAALTAGHALVTPSCARDSTVALHAAFAVAMLAALAATALSLRAWRRSGGRAPLADSGGDGGRHAERDLFVALIGVAAGAYFTLVTVTQWSALALLGPCAQ
jgi:hypothetical protein